MAIQNRRGVYTDFDASKMVAGEFAVVQSGDPDSPNGVSLYVAFQSGTVKRIALIDDVNETVGSLEDLETTAKTSIVDSINELAEKASIYHGVTSTSGATRDKVVVCSDFELKDGVYIAVDFSQNNTATNARLNVNNTGAKSIVASGNSYVTDWIVSGSTYLFRFEDNALGGAYYLIGATERIPSDSAPIMDGTATSGTSKQYARADHVHPSDTSRASAAALTETDAEVAQLKEDLTAEETAREAADDAINAELATKADADGVIASAEQLLSDKYTIDQVPYTFRASGGNGADREYDEIVGGSVVWNQLFSVANVQANANGVNFTVNNNKSISVTGTPITTYANIVPVSNARKIIQNHVYATFGTPSNYMFGFAFFTENYNSNPQNCMAGTIVKNTTNCVNAIPRVLGMQIGTEVNFTISPISFIDLTALLGSSVADYLYTLDSATAGAGIAKLKSWGFLQKDYYAYDAGSMEHVSGISAHEMVGFNQWDEEWENGWIDDNGTNAVMASRIRSKSFIRCIPDTVYYFECGSQQSWYKVCFYDSEKNFISTRSPNTNNVFTTPSNAQYMRFAMNDAYGITYKNDICINLHWSGTRDGEYEPYVKHSYALDDSLTLRGIPKLDASGNLYYDGDIWHPDGTIDRRYGVVDLGTLNWNVTQGEAPFFGGDLPFNSIVNSVENSRCQKYAPTTSVNGYKIYSGAEDKVYAIAGVYIGNATNKIYIADSSYTDAAAFKTAVSGVYLVYELATSTTEQATPYHNPQIVDPEGTEEYICTSLVPVGHETKYFEDLKSKIEGLPSNFATLIADTEKTFKATKNYAQGDYLIVNNQLYKVTSAITSGSTITPNTNVTATTIMAEIMALA